MEVLDQEEQRLALEAPLDQRASRQRDLALELLGLDVRMRLALEAEHVAQDRRDRRRLVVPRAERSKTIGELLPRDVQRVARLDLVRLAKERAEDAVRRLAERGARGAAHGDARQSSVGLQPRQELRDEPRRPALHPVERGQELTELVDSPDERCGQPERCEAAGRSWLRQGADQAVDQDRLGLASQRQLTGGLEREAMVREAAGGLGDQDRSGIRGGEQA